MSSSEVVDHAGGAATEQGEGHDHRDHKDDRVEDRSDERVDGRGGFHDFIVSHESSIDDRGSP